MSYKNFSINNVLCPFTISYISHILDIRGGTCGLQATPDSRAIWLKNLKILSKVIKKLVTNRGLGMIKTHCIPLGLLSLPSSQHFLEHLFQNVYPVEMQTEFKTKKTERTTYFPKLQSFVLFVPNNRVQG